MVVLRPMKVGDFVSVAGVTGTVVELGLFTTTINTPDNVQTILGNNKVFSETIQNFTVNPFRRVDLKCQLSGAADHQAAMVLLREKIAAIPNVLPEPKVDVEILDFTLVGPVLVRPYCHNDNYWQVYFDTNKVLREALAEAGFPSPCRRRTSSLRKPPDLRGRQKAAKFQISRLFAVDRDL
jgi:small conductance mechanosensitive channel